MMGDRVHTVENGNEAEDKHSRRTPPDPVKVVPQRTYYLSVIGTSLATAAFLSGPLLFMHDARIDQRIDRHNRDDQAHSQPTSSLRAHVAVTQQEEIYRRALSDRLDRFETQFQDMNRELTRLRTLLEERTKVRVAR